MGLNFISKLRLQSEDRGFFVASVKVDVCNAKYLIFFRVSPGLVYLALRDPSFDVGEEL